MAPIAFHASAPLTIGVELELQLLSPVDLDLAPASPRLLDHLDRHPHAGSAHHEITQGMLEVNTGIHPRAATLLDELRQMRDDVVTAASSLNLAVAGGGSHPFQRWPDQRIFDRVPRAVALADLFGYLAKVNTVFGQHVHVGCTGAEDALYLVHALSRYVPHLIALSAASPFALGADTSFACSRLNVALAFPLSGRMPCLLTWADFTEYFERLRRLGIGESIKDFYWDIRPKPEFGTVEVRVCDTPLTIERAAALAAFVQALAAYLLETRPQAPVGDDYLTYAYTRFAACRFGLDAMYIDPEAEAPCPLRDHLLATLETLSPYAARLDSEDLLDRLRRVAETGTNDARWMRNTFREAGSLPALMRRQARRWAEDA